MTFLANRFVVIFAFAVFVSLLIGKTVLYNKDGVIISTRIQYNCVIIHSIPLFTLTISYAVTANISHF